MSSQRTVSSRRISTHSNRKASGIVATKRADFHHKKYTLTICLHVKLTQVKGRATAQLSPISSPFQHKTLTNISKRTKWTEIEEGIKALLFPLSFEQNLEFVTLILPVVLLDGSVVGT